MKLTVLHGCLVPLHISLLYQWPVCRCGKPVPVFSYPLAGNLPVVPVPDQMLDGIQVFLLLLKGRSRNMAGLIAVQLVLHLLARIMPHCLLRGVG